MKIDNNRPITVQSSMTMQSQVNEYKDKIANNEGYVEAFEFRLLNQDSFIDQLDFLKHIDSYEQLNPNVNKLGAQGQANNPLDAEKRAKLKAYAEERLPSLIDSMFNEIAQRANRSNFDAEFSRERQYISDQIHTAMAAQEPGNLYDLIHSNVYSLSQVAFTEGQIKGFVAGFDKDKPLNTKEGIAGHIATMQADYDEAYNQIATHNKDADFVNLLKSRREHFVSPLEGSLTEAIGFNPYENPSYDVHYNVRRSLYPLNNESVFNRPKPISVMV